MNSLNKVISTTKKLIDLPYNKFNLENYYEILEKSFSQEPYLICTNKNLPIKLMSGGNDWSAIVTNISAENERNIKGRKIYLVGKGILFDSGGLNLKIDDNMGEMHNDKAGMLIALAVANYLKRNTIAYCPVTTNFVHNSKITPGDVIAIGKKKVEVTNTDAEGRLILAEALTAIDQEKDDIIITIATLTGAVSRAIGEKATGVFSNNHNLLSKFSEASYEAKEYAWALPLWDYLEKKYYKGKIIKNYISDIKCGATQGALFIKQFVKYPNNWIHIDIAYSAFTDGVANGVPIKSLINFIRKLQ